MKQVTIQYQKEIAKFSKLELELAKKITLVVAVANKMIDTHVKAQTVCPIKKVGDMEWDILRCVNVVQLNMKKPPFSLDVTDSALTVSQDKSMFAVIKEQE